VTPQPSASARLSWSEAGDPAGPVVVYFHGTQKASQSIPFPDVAGRLGVRMLMVDRPGYGGSAPIPGATLLDIGGMVLADLVDVHGVDRFSVLGWSGGGPHALGCAAVPGTRVRAVGLLASWAPMDPPHRGLPRSVRVGMRCGAVLPRSALRAMFALGRQSSEGMVDDTRRVAKPWGFDIDRVAAAVPVFAWHCQGDRQVPVAPWREFDGIDLSVLPCDSHDVSSALWETAVRRVARG
jgi:pimeloyl-ACP methyl ester carboxylesterase